MAHSIGIMPLPSGVPNAHTTAGPLEPPYSRRSHPSATPRSGLCQDARAEIFCKEAAFSSVAHVLHAQDTSQIGPGIQRAAPVGDAVARQLAGQDIDVLAGGHTTTIAR